MQQIVHIVNFPMPKKYTISLRFVPEDEPFRTNVGASGLSQAELSSWGSLTQVLSSNFPDWTLSAWSCLLGPHSSVTTCRIFRDRDFLLLQTLLICLPRKIPRFGIFPAQFFLPSPPTSISHHTSHFPQGFFLYSVTSRSKNELTSVMSEGNA